MAMTAMKGQPQQRRSTTAKALTYTAAQAARVAFYGAHYLAARWLARVNFAAVEEPAHPLPSMLNTLTAMRDLFVQDWKNVQEGLYPMPVDVAGEMQRAAGSLQFLRDIPRVIDRQRRKAHNEVRRSGNGLPRYYQQNFHFQTDGYLSENSARLYEFQVEALFAGTADAMRRRAYVPIAHFLQKSKARPPVLLDIGAGTGEFLAFVKSAQPKLKTIALDLSKPYLAQAKRAMREYADVDFIAAPAEAMPLPDKSIDVAASIFLFHELPPKVRAAVVKEIARVLKPGGLFVLADTIQHGDAPAFEGLIDVFPSLLHEPYYASYTKTDLDDLFGSVGLKHVETDIAYLTKIVVFEKSKQKSRAQVC
jgi:ubiquinone/menaquinone biosynthesis C-methylase UbiE